MITEIGHFSLILAFSIACVQAFVLLLGAQMRWSGWMSIAVPAATLQFMLTAGAFIALTWAFVNSDFSVRLVTLNSHSLKPMLYKVTGVWGNHEGSMLLWVLIVTLFGAFAAWFGGNLPPLLKARVLGVQALIGAAFFAFILFTSNPFDRIRLPPFDGQDLNPLLQDPGLAFHPPFLYLGYVGLSMTYSFAIAALLEGKVEAAWGRWVRPYTLAAWVFLTVGIGLGSWWAYYELGWGGFWFWDPVENASFMPWLATAALLHCAIVVEKRESLKSWTVLLAIVAFGFSMVGAFLTRSGVITSVHAFASDPERGMFLLLILAVFMIAGLTLFAARAGEMHSKGVFSIASRESALVLNNVLLGVSAFVVFTGTIWPLVSEIFFDRKLSVGPPFFNTAFTPFMVALALILPVGAMLPWKRARVGRVLRQLSPAFALALAVVALLWAIQTGRSILGPVGVALGAWLVAGSVSEIWTRSKGNAARALRFPLADWGKAVAHCGLGVTIAGIAGLTAWEVEDIRAMSIGDEMSIAGYSISFEDVARVNGPNYMATRGVFALSRNGREIGNLYPEKRTYPVAGMPTTEAAINNGFFRDIYVVLGDRQHDGGWTVRTYYKPLANWIWGGAILMALGGLLSLSDRRHRVAAGARGTAAEGISA
ncbi:MAG: heme lyase CcmF/NrfE family subunit [Roseovarius sp.]|nr:heme lyase CcmF/NrfE family subunit [Roseovarius sp.]MCY4207336.1 heme lyase CcmF/NrfE family subunit [Roseovarius sp.]MCY4291779.1 heme lyase CcmF/NrfE family subunit [Roseovarius sp.]MCY4316454.1 heme lyase CcmF/NrfE family subunit [Roseovarius sp.]